jgi:outer membrane murein-binding lipoprotein Lpp
LRDKIKLLGAVILAATMVAGCSAFETEPQTQTTQQTTTTTTTACPSGTQMQANGMCQ